MNECLAVRDRLTEYAVSTLSSSERAEVERHLAWCAGCRKEASELRGGAALAGLALQPAEPPPTLEDRVVVVVRNAAAKAVPPKRGGRWARSATILAAIVGLMALAGGLIARQQSTEDKLAHSERQAKAFERQLDTLIRDFPEAQAARPHAISRAILGPSGGRSGGGGALRIVSPRFEDLAVVTVGGLEQRDGPFRLWLLTPSGRRLAMGKMTKLDTAGGAAVVREFTEDLRLYHYVEIRDARGDVVLSGAFGGD